MTLFRAALALTFCGAFLTAATRAPRVKKPKPAEQTTGPKINPIVQKWIKSLSTQQKVAQLIVMPCYGEFINPRSRAFKQYKHLVNDLHIGGMIALGHVRWGSVKNADPYAMAAFFNHMQKMAKIPLLTASDFERGASMRVNDATQWPYNMAFSAARDLDGSRYQGAYTAKEARALGVTWIFAPDVDVNNNPDNPIINIRSYGENPQDVAAHAQAYIQGAHSDPKTPVLVTAKHFPGHGDTASDSHLGQVRLDADKQRIDAIEMVPFRAAIDAGVDSIMTAHISVPALDPDGVPATVSPKMLTGLLRNELKFNGIVVTDAMDMKGLSQMYDTGESAVRALEAGADVLLMPRKAEDAIEGVMEAIKSHRLTEERIDQSVLRVLNAKARLGLNKKKIVDIKKIGDVVGDPDANERAQQIADRAVTLIKDDKDQVPLHKPDETCLVVLAENRYSNQGRRLIDEVTKRAPKVKSQLFDPSISTDELEQATQDTSACASIVVAAFASFGRAAGLPGDFPALVNKLLAGKVPVTVLALGSPYLLRMFPNAAAYMTTYSTTPTSEVAAAKALFGEIALTGKLPVTIPGLAKYGDGRQLPLLRPTPKGL